MIVFLEFSTIQADDHIATPQSAGIDDGIHNI